MSSRSLKRLLVAGGAGFIGSNFVRLLRSTRPEVEITVLTFWASMAAIHEFAGPDATVAVVEPAARAVLQTFDERAEHFELALFAEP